MSDKSVAPIHHDNIAISLHDVGKTYKIYNHPSDRLKQSFMGGRRHYFTEHEALQPLSLDIGIGQTVGILGENGSGKSTLLQLVTKTLTPTSGDITVNGRVSALLELGAGFNPEFSGHENIYLNGSILGLSRAQIDACYESIVSFSGLEARMLLQPVKTYSSGMYVRLAFAVAIAVEPDILIVDEALAVGDEGFQRKCFARIKALQEKGATILFVSHAARTIIDLCDHAILLDAGELLMQGRPASVVASYHKMLFAKPEDRAAIRQDILGHHKSSDAPKEMIATKMPETRTEYASNGAAIDHITLCDAHGDSVSIMQQGYEYTVKYHVRFDVDLAAARCAMTIKTMTGIELAASIYHGDGKNLCNVKAGDIIDMAFTFPCALLKGDYFINVGVVKEEFGTITFLHRIVDALHVKVVPREGLRDNVEATGIIDIGAKCTLLKLE